MQAPEIIDNRSIIPKFKDGTKLTAEKTVTLWALARENPTLPSCAILKRAGSPDITVRHCNRLRIEWGFNRCKGRPRKQDAGGKSVNLPVPVIQEDIVWFIGVHLFSCWMEMQEEYTMILEQLKLAIEFFIEENPTANFPLLSHKDETLMRRFKALFFAPLFNVGKLIEYDVKEHALKTVIGKGYQSSTLNQFLGQLERIDAAQWLMNSLLPFVLHGCNTCFIDGHMIPFWTRVSMHKGKITMLGRIMAGSQAVVAHIETGQAVYFEYHPPDTRLPSIILGYCAEIAALIGINMFVIDREVNSVGMAQAFTERGWGLLSMLDNNEYKDLSDWDTEYVGKLEDGSEVYSGRWSEEKKNKAKDPRIFALVVKGEKLLPFWGTEVVAEKVPYLKWPGLYSRRTEIQENSFKRMKEHGALTSNFGTKKIESEDRHHGRKVEKLTNRLENIGKRIAKKKEKIDEQEKKVRESEEKGHGKRLDQRENRLAVMNDDYKNVASKREDIEKKVEKIGPPGKRSDRDFRKQSIMTFRTLLLENKLMVFMSLLMGCIAEAPRMGLESLIRLLFERSGGFYETPAELVYSLNMNGLSKSNRVTMLKLIEGINKMELEKMENLFVCAQEPARDLG
ncbi:MAG: hypothetical protein GY864_08745 [Desulfobacterales bacterium]|nr:hypothetical protein [Desulfobacterales bacterium]